MEGVIRNVLACPSCKVDLIEKENLFACDSCKQEYLVSCGVPHFIEHVIEDENNATETFPLGRYKVIKFLRDFFGAPKTSLALNPKILDKLLKKSKLTLNIGSSSKKLYAKTINLDIGNFKGVDVVADGKHLPFKDNSFDLILLESVLEHIDAPEVVLAESARVLKKGGSIFVSIPFVFVFHGSPDDFGRLTKQGLKRRFEQVGLKVSEEGIVSGPGSTLNQVLRYFFATLFSFNSKILYSLLLHFFGWITFWLKYIDLLFINNKKSHIMGNVLYSVAKK